MNRQRKFAIAAAVTGLWLVYMFVGLALINSFFPTVAGEGPEGTAAFIGLISGFFVTGFIMWAFSD
jgi:hypothetical protein